MGRFDEAVPPHLRSVEIRRAALGADHPSVARALDNLGGVYIELNRLEEAEAMCLEAMATREKVLDPEHPSIGMSYHNLARVYRAQGRRTEAEEMYRRSLAVLTSAYDPGHPQRVGVAASLAEFLRELGREQEALEVEAQEARAANAGFLARTSHRNNAKGDTCYGLGNRNPEWPQFLELPQVAHWDTLVSLLRQFRLVFANAIEHMKVSPEPIDSPLRGTDLPRADCRWSSMPRRGQGRDCETCSPQPRAAVGQTHVRG